MSQEGRNDRGPDRSTSHDSGVGSSGSGRATRTEGEGETLVTRDIRFANHVLEQMAVGSPLGGVVLIREQKMADIQQPWRDFLKDPRAPRSIALLTTGSIRFREHPGSAGER